MRRAYENIDFVVTIDQVMTSTAHYSDLVLPAAMSWECDDFNNGGFYCQKAIEPLGEARSDWEIIKGMCSAIGRDDIIPWSEEEALRMVLDTPENLEAGMGFDEYRKSGFFLGEYNAESSVMGEYNPLGRTQFYLEELPPRDDYGQTFETSDRLPSYKESFEAYRDNPDREKYPLYGFSNHDVYHGQSLWAHNAWLDYFRTVDGLPFCRIHEEAAAERGIKTGDTVRIFNDHGECVLNALVTKGIRKDSVWVPHGFYWDEFIAGTAQELTAHCPDPVSSNSNFNDWICQVEKYEGGAN